ncbi:MAG: amidohydrolase [Firmicutes bacterium]|mgnify:CR=1 FL=1|nr:amidohydrolase [Bacillota bacterium]
MSAIDVHSHFFPKSFLDLVEREGSPYGAGIQRDGSTPLLFLPGHPPVPLFPEFVDLPARIAYLDARGITLQALSLSPPMVYWAPPRLGLELARAFNDGIAEVCRSQPRRFVGLATLPLQDVEAALRETERAVRELGMRGIYLATSVNGRYLDDPGFEPVWQLAAELEIPVFVHPTTYIGEEVLARFHLFNTIGFPTETAALVGRLIYSGLLDRQPRVRVVLAHGGGVFPFLLGRLDHAHRSRRELQDAIPRPPSGYLDHFYFDTVVHGEGALAYVVRTVGVQRMILGSDAPYDMADDDPVGRVRRLGLGEEQERAVLEGTARRLLGLDGAGKKP